MTLPQPKVEIRFDGTNWDDVTDWVRMRDGISISRGRDDEVGDPLSVGTCTLSLDNNEGEFSPDLPASANYPYVVDGVAIRVSMWTGTAYSTRFYGTVQDWTVQWLNPVGTQAKATVTASGVVGDFPSYTLRQAADEIVRQIPNVVAHWPLRDSASPALPMVGSANLVATDTNATGWGLGGLLGMDEGTEQHVQFTASSGGLRLVSEALAIPEPWTLYLVLMEAPTASGTLIDFGGPATVKFDSGSGNYYFNGDLASGNRPADYPAILVVASDGGVFGDCALDVRGTSDVETSTGNPAGTTQPAGTLRQIKLNPVLSGASVWSAAHLFVVGALETGTAIWDSQARLLGPRTRTDIDVPSLLSEWAGGATVSGATAGDITMPNLDGRDLADVLSAIVSGMGARLVDDMDGTLTWLPFPISSTAVALPSGEVDPSVTWQTSDVGRYSDVTVTWPDGTSYTATRPDGKRSSTSVEGVHATRADDRSWADWLVWNTASTGQSRQPRAPYDLATLGDTDTATLASVTVGSRISLSGLPSQMPSTLTLIVEGIDEQISDSQWLVTFKTSPDVYSRLMVWDSGDTWDGGKLWAP